MTWQQEAALDKMLNPDPCEMYRYQVHVGTAAFQRTYLGTSSQLLHAAKEQACAECDFELAAEIRDLMSLRRKPISITFCD